HALSDRHPQRGHDEPHAPALWRDHDREGHQPPGLGRPQRRDAAGRRVTTHFVPPHPPRRSGPVAVWRGFVGERARTLVYGWSERAFALPYIRRRVFGYNVHI